VVADPPLARELYKKGVAGREIGPDQYRSVAGHYSELRANQQMKS